MRILSHPWFVVATRSSQAALLLLACLLVVVPATRIPPWTVPFRVLCALLVVHWVVSHRWMLRRTPAAIYRGLREGDASMPRADRLAACALIAAFIAQFML